MSNVYSYERIQIVMAGKVVAACTMIEYEEDTTTTPVHVLGKRNPHVNIQSTAVYTGKVGLMYEEYDALQDSIPAGRSLTSIAPFEIICSRLDSANRMRYDKLKGVTIKKVPKTFSGGETSHDIELDLNILEIEYNV